MTWIEVWHAQQSVRSAPGSVPVVVTGHDDIPHGCLWSSTRAVARHLHRTFPSSSMNFLIEGHRDSFNDFRNRLTYAAQSWSFTPSETFPSNKARNRPRSRSTRELVEMVPLDQYAAPTRGEDREGRNTSEERRTGLSPVSLSNRPKLSVRN